MTCWAVRPDRLVGIPALAELYSDLIEQLGLEDVTVIGNSTGGWITAEIALLRSPRIGLAGRLGTLGIPALVLWGDSDRIADPDYGRA
jgi:pimeloyl-ACP methyl ester carboxylesterase